MPLFKRKNSAEGIIDQAFVGLGNPGDEYSNTRHNIGWMILSEISKKYSASYKKGSGEYYHARVKIDQKNILLVLPTTYMNHSGKAVKHLKRKFSLPLNKICVIVDEYNFPLGKLHLKGSGSAGGHNGLKSIIHETDSREFLRLRCGIDKNFPDGGLVDYVLSDFAEDEWPEVNSMISNGVKALEHLALNAFPNSMSGINSGEIFNDKS